MAPIIDVFEATPWTGSASVTKTNFTASALPVGNFFRRCAWRIGSLGGTGNPSPRNRPPPIIKRNQTFAHPIPN
jgi:hypothetical protein